MKILPKGHIVQGDAGTMSGEVSEGAPRQVFYSTFILMFLNHTSSPWSCRPI